MQKYVFLCHLVVKTRIKGYVPLLWCTISPVIPYFVKKIYIYIEMLLNIFKLYNHYVVSILFWRFNQTEKGTWTDEQINVC